ncbi:MAG: aldolase, partial [Sphingomonas oligoaromativorans]
DYSELSERGGRLIATPPERLAGKMEVRGIGVIDMPYQTETDVALIITLDEPVDRMPEFATRDLAGVDVPAATLAALEPSAPIKVELMLREIGR